VSRFSIDPTWHQVEDVFASRQTKVADANNNKEAAHLMMCAA
jgi:hypothetical protein